MKARIKPSAPGPIRDVIIFEGDTTVHPCLYQSNEPRTHFRLRLGMNEDRTPNMDLPSLAIRVGDAIVEIEDGVLRVVPGEIFRENWEIVP